MADETKKKVLLIINPISGRRRTALVLNRLRHAVSERFDLIERETAGPGHATALAAEAPPDTRAVLVYGGDGTIREAAEGLMRHPAPIYHVPVGNENLFAKHFGQSHHGPWVAAALERNRVRQVDMVEVNGRGCAAFLGVGFDAHVVRLVAAKRHGHISHLNYVWPIVRTVFGYRFPHLEVESEGKSVFAGQGMLFAGNIARYAVGIPLFKRAIDNDGLLDVAIFPCRTRLAFLKDVILTLRQKHYAHKDVIFLRTSHLKVRGETHAASQVDGDVGPPLPLEVRVHPLSLNVLLP